MRQKKSTPETNLKNKAFKNIEEDLPVYIPKPGSDEIQSSFIRHFTKTLSETTLPISKVCDMLSVPERIVKLWLNQGKDIYEAYIPIKDLTIIQKRLYTFYTQVINIEAVRLNTINKSLLESGRDLKWYLQQMYPETYSLQKEEEVISSEYSDLTEEELLDELKKTL